jgi:superfamily II DNA or RNA helicase
LDNGKGKMNILLREYQAELQADIIDKLFVEDVNKLCVALATGGGKSILIAKTAQDLPGRTLILTHRIEILNQNSEWLPNVSYLTAKDETLRYDAKIVIAMVQTAYARIKKYGTAYLGEFDNIILDEVQVLIFQKVFEQYNFKKLIGFTGTPVLNKKKFTTIDGVEYVEPFTLSEIFDDIVQGASTQKLIDLGWLVQDYNIVLNLPDFDKLKESTSNPDGYTSQSLTDVYSNTASLQILNQAYEEHCKGKKTLIFNATTKVNDFVYQNFKKAGINVKMFDTVNNVEKREDVIAWFKSEKDAVLINTNVFTTGFDVTDVEVVIVNRATKSLALWIQMVGRGSRPTTKIFKDHFTVIDLGQNIHEHGVWSMERNWKDFFYSPGKKRKHISDMLDTWECVECGALNITGELYCVACGAEKMNAVISRGSDKKNKTGELVALQETPLPRAHTIIKYTKALDETANFAFLLLERKIVELFINHNVTSDFYSTHRERFVARVEQIYRPIYFAIIRSDLNGSRKKLKTQYKRVLDKVDKIYGYKN